MFSSPDNIAFVIFIIVLGVLSCFLFRLFILQFLSSWSYLALPLRSQLYLVSCTNILACFKCSFFSILLNFLIDPRVRSMMNRLLRSGSRCCLFWGLCRSLGAQLPHLPRLLSHLPLTASSGPDFEILEYL